MRTGVFIPSTLLGTTAGQVVAYARAAEGHGFDSLAVAGRLVHDSYEPLVALTLAAAATRGRVRVSAVTAGMSSPR